MRMVKHWSRLPRMAMDASSLEHSGSGWTGLWVTWDIPAYCRIGLDDISKVPSNPDYSIIVEFYEKSACARDTSRSMI